MKNQPYPLYEMSHIRDLKEMLEQKEKQMPAGIAFTYPKERGQTLEIKDFVTIGDIVKYLELHASDVFFYGRNRGKQNTLRWKLESVFAVIMISINWIIKN